MDRRYNIARYGGLITLIAFFIVALVPALALSENQDEWRVDAAATVQNSAPSDTITKWCEDNGARVQYSNVKIPGYKPCGVLEAKATCDAFGRKFISAVKDPPYGYLDCGLNPRIYIESEGKQLDLKEIYKDRDSETAPVRKTKKKSYVKSLDNILDGNSAPKTAKAVPNNQELEKMVQETLKNLGSGSAGSTDLQSIIQNVLGNPDAIERAIGGK